MKFIEFISHEIEKLVGAPVLFFWNRESRPEGPYNVYQTEDLTAAGKFEGQYKKFLDGAEKVYDYSKQNLEIYPGEFLPYLPDTSLKFNYEERLYPVLFYGMRTVRRRPFLNKVRVEDNLDLDVMKALVPEHWVLSVGSYSNRCNDLMRITPALNMGGRILMEKSQEDWCNDYLLDNFKDRITIL